jgi:Putative zinc-finger
MRWDVPKRERPNALHLGEALSSYCFGDLTERDRDDVESHLLECESCWEEFQRVDAAVRTLRLDVAGAVQLPARELVSALGLSGRMALPFGGHRTFTFAISCLFGLEWMIGLWSELGYSYDRFGRLAWELSFPVFIWVTVIVLLAFWIDTRATRSGGFTGLWKSVTILGVGLGAAMVGLLLILPAESTIQASFQTRTAAGGYLKDAELIFAPLLIFFVPAFHTVLQLQRELVAGRPQQVMRLFAVPAERLVPRAMIFLSPRLLAGFLVVYGIVKIVGANHMLDALTPGPYAQLFTVASYISTGIWFAIAIVSLAWYMSRLNDLKREAIALTALEHRRLNPTEH